MTFRQPVPAGWLASAAVSLCLVAAADAFTISGTVRNQVNTPIANVAIKLFDDNDNPIGIPPTVTNGAGFYSIAGLPNGRYTVQFEPPVSSRLVAARTENIDVINNNPIVDRNLANGFLLSGRVRDIHGAGIEGIDLDVAAGATTVLTPGDDSDATGFYDVIVPVGSWDIQWRRVVPSHPNYITVTQLGVAFGPDRVIDVVMEIGVTVAGTIRNGANQPLANVNLDFVDAATGVELVTPGDNTTAAGQYSVEVPVRTYTIRVKPQPGTLLVPREFVGMIVNGASTFNVQLQSGFLLSGTVRRPDTSAIADADIDVDSPAGTRLYTPNDNTNSSGVYSAVVPAGTWNVTFEPPVGMLLAAQRQVGVVVNGPRTLNATLQAGVLVGGTVSRTGSPVANVDIDVTVAGTATDVPLVGDLSNASGNWSVVLPSGSYDFYFEPAFALGYLTHKVGGVMVPAQTTVNAALQAGFRVSGNCVDMIGTSLPNVDVDVINPSNGTELLTSNDKSNNQGAYGIVVPAGTWRFVFTPDPATIVADPVVVEKFVNTHRRIHAQFTAVVITDSDPAGPPPRPLARLLANVPNPFNPTTTLVFEMTRPGPVRLDVFDGGGRRVRVLWAGRSAVGSHRVAWDGRDDRGNRMPSGVYFARLQAHGTRDERKLVLLR